MKNDSSLHAMQFFKDRHGNVVIWQWPNLLLYSWVAFKLLSVMIHNTQFKSGFAALSAATLFTWAYLEITEGVNYFRKTLGILVLGFIVIGFFLR